MTREQSLAALKSDVPAERLAAARYLQFWALPIDVPALRGAIARESVGWVRRALESALLRLGDERSVVVDLDELSADEEESSADVAALARARVARTVVHELEPIVGAIGYYASTEFDDYEVSQTKLHVERLSAMFRAIETLAAISTTPRRQAFDLARLVYEVVEGERSAFPIGVRVEGPTRLNLSSDPNLIRLIVSNAVKNACESALSVLDRETSVQVLYGSTERDGWVTVEDDGVGLPPGSSAKLFEMGTSTKEDHLGMGLTLSSEAARALGGKIRLVTESDRTRFEFNFSTSTGGNGHP